MCDTQLHAIRICTVYDYSRGLCQIQTSLWCQWTLFSEYSKKMCYCQSKYGKLDVLTLESIYSKCISNSCTYKNKNEYIYSGNDINPHYGNENPNYGNEDPNYGNENPSYCGNKNLN